MSFSENVLVVEMSYQNLMLELLSFCNQGKTQPPLFKITVLTFLVKNSKMKLFWESIFENMQKIFYM